MQIKSLLPGLDQCPIQALANPFNRPTVYLHIQEMLEQVLSLAVLQREGTVQQAHLGTKPVPIVTRLCIGRKR